MRRLLALLLLLPAVALQAATTTAADAAVVAGFEIDGNVGVDGGGTDWSSTGTRTTDPTGNADGSNFTGGSKEFQNPTDWKEGTGTSTNQGDISDVYSHFLTDGSQSWGFLGFRRLAEQGTMTFMAELNQKPNLPKEAGDSVQFRPNRTVNDLLMRFEQDGNGSFSLTAAYKWTQSAGGTFATGCFTVPGYATPSAWCPTSTSGAGFAGATGENKLFAEGAVNLSSFDSVGDCRGAYGVMNVRSFAGDSESSSLLDFVGGVGIDVPPTCGQLIITKVDQFDDPVGGATYKVTPNPIPGVTGAAAAELVVRDGSAQDPDGQADGTVSFNPAKPGTYTVEETIAPDGYIRDTTVRTDVVVGNSGTSVARVEVTNPLVFAPPSIENEPVATYDKDHNWKVTKSVDRNHADVPQGTKADFAYTVELEALPADRSGWELGGTVTVTNPNAHDMVVTLDAGITGGAGCTVAAADQSPAAGLQVLLSPGANPFTYTCPAGADTGDGSTTATITWDPAVYPQQGPGATYARTAEADYAFAVDQRTDEQTTVTDTFDGGSAEALGTFTWGDVWAAPDHTVVVKTYTRSLDGVPGTCTTYPNTARESADDTSDSESVKVCVGKDLVVSKDASLGYQRVLEWDIAKGGPGTVFTGRDEQGQLRRSVRYSIDVTADGWTDSQWALTGTIKVSNPNDWAVPATVTDTVVVDTKTLTCSVVGGADATIPANAVDVPFPYTCDGVQQGDYVGKNTATVDWSDAPHAYPHTSASTTVDVAVTGDPEPANATVTLSDLLDGEDVTGDLPQTSFDWATVNAMPGHTQRIQYDVLLGTTADACTPHTNKVTIDQTGQSAEHTVTVCSPGVTKTVEADYGRKQLWDLDKQVDKTSVEIAEGGQATFTYTVTATPGDVVDDGTASWAGTVSVHNPSPTEPLTVDVTDLPDVAGWTCELTDDSTGVVLAGGETAVLGYECTGTGHPSGTNTAVVGFGDQSVSRTVDVAFQPRPGIRDSVVEVRDDKTNPDQPSVLLGEADASDPDSWTFTYQLTKSGAAGTCTTYTNTAVALLEASEDPTDSASTTLCVEKPVTVDVSGSGSYGVTYPWTIDKQVDRTRVEVDAATGGARFDYVVTVRAGVAQPAGWTMGGQVVVTNPNTYQGGAITLTGVDVTTDVGGGADCTATLPESPVVAPDGTLAVPYTCTFSGTPATSGTVHATVTWDPAGPATEATAEDGGSTSLTVGQETNKVVDVVDDKTDPAHPVVLEKGLTWAPGLVKEYPYSATHGGTPGTCTAHTNTAVVDLPTGTDPTDSTTVTVCVEKPVTVDVSGSGSYGVTYPWTIDKQVDRTRVEVDAATGGARFDYVVTVRAGAAQPAGWTMGGQVVVTNPNTYQGGAIALTGVDVTTDVGGGADCTATLPESPVVAPDGTLAVPYTCTFSGTPATSGTVHATVTWDPAGPATEATAEDGGSTSLTVGQETNKVVDVVDDKTDPAHPVVLEKGLTWAPGLVKEYPYSAIHGGTPGTCTAHTNTAVVDLPTGTDPTDSTTVTVCVEKPLGAAATAGADLARAYGWSIDKVADATERTVDPGTGTATFRYTVTVRAAEATDSGWRTSGSVTLTNTNAYEEGGITADVAAATDLGGGSACVVEGGSGVDVPIATQAGPGTVTLPVSCTFTSRPASSGTLTATATWDPAGEAATASATATAPVTFGVRSETDKVVDVVDDKTRPGTRVVLEQGLTWQSGLVKSYTYDLAIPGPAVEGCADHTNTATVDLPVGADVSDTATVRVCTPAVSPEQASGKARGSVTATCQGTVRAKLVNRTGERVTYTLRVGTKVHRIAVKAGAKRKFTTTGAPRAKVVLRAQGKVLDRIRVPKLCAPPEVLPETGLRTATAARRAALADRWR